jgi:dihydrofolate reductase
LTIAMIWAQDANGLLGTGTDMVWNVPDDFQHFKNETMGNPVIMGRGSWEALGCKPLPGRKNIVMTEQPDYVAPGAEVVHSLEEALAIARWSSGKTWIAGGANVYEQAMSIADELVITDLELEADTGGGPAVYAPKISDKYWRVDESRSDTDWRPKSGDARWRVTTYVRRK